MRILFPLMVIAVAFSSCKKEPVEREVHENLVVDSNQIPPYDGVTSVQVKNYINRLCIDLTGMEPLDDELNDAYDLLVSNRLNDSSRTVVIENLMSTDKYYQKLFENTSSTLLEGADSLEIYYKREEFNYIVDYYLSNGDFVEAQILALEVIKLDYLLAARSQLQAGAIDIVSFYQRFIYNFFYDEINMGSLNFVMACFESLLKRKPTDSELNNAISMVDSQTGQIFLQDGNSKGDFIVIITTVDEFYHGLVIDVYRTLLGRKPSSPETNEGVTLIKNSGNLKSLQTKVLKSQEYARF